LSRHRYPRSHLVAEGARSAVGLALTVGPIVLLDPIVAFAVPLYAGAALFALAAARTWMRHQSVLEVDDAGLRLLGPWPADIPWTELRDVRLRFFSTRRDRERGWMQLVVSGKARSIRLDSTLTGFSDIVSRAAIEAVQRRIPLSSATLENLRGMGISGLVVTSDSQTH
jgi:hypothetical protein